MLFLVTRDRMWQRANLRKTLSAADTSDFTSTNTVVAKATNPHWDGSAFFLHPSLSRQVLGYYSTAPLQLYDWANLKLGDELLFRPARLDVVSWLLVALHQSWIDVSVRCPQ